MIKCFPYCQKKSHKMKVIVRHVIKEEKKKAMIWKNILCKF